MPEVKPMTREQYDLYYRGTQLSCEDFDKMKDIDENLVILNKNVKKISPENRQKLLDMARLMFKEEFDDDDNINRST